MQFKALNLALFVMMNFHIIAKAQPVSPLHGVAEVTTLYQTPQQGKDSFLLIQGDCFFDLYNINGFEKAMQSSVRALEMAVGQEQPAISSQDLKYQLLEIDNMLKEHDNITLRKNKEDLTFQSLILYIFSAFLFLCLLTTFYFFWKNRIFIRQIKEQNQLIKTHDDTTSILIKEIHHRIKNNLQIINSLIELQLNKADVDYQTSMMEIQSKMGTIALAHHLLYEMPDMKEVDLQAYFESMVEMTIRSLMPGSRSIETHIEMNCQKMTLEKLVTLAIAVNEMIINTIKHVFPKVDACVIELNCESDETGFVFTYKDNGIIQEHEDERIFKGMGMRLIRSLIQQMDGHIEIDRGVEGNLEYFIRFHHKDYAPKYKPITELNQITA